MASSRRTFLKQTFLGTVALSTARPFCAVTSASGEVPALAFFTEGEHAVIAAVAQRLIGITGDSGVASPPIDIPRRADLFLSTEDPEIQDQIHLLLTIFNSQFAALVFSLKFSSFLEMGPESQDEYLDGWMTSRLGFRRTGFQALKRLCMSMYYTDPASFSALGYAPMVTATEAR